MSDLHHPSMLAEFKEFRHPCLLPGESRREFETIRRMIIDDIRPGTNIEWLWTLDLVDLSWEILRRCLKQKTTLEAFRLAAVEAFCGGWRAWGSPPTQHWRCMFLHDAMRCSGAKIQTLPPKSKHV
jgi:hypothetical protein